MKQLFNSYYPLVSIIIPTVNESIDFFHRCLTSIKNQSYEKIEIIVIDEEFDNGKSKVIHKYGGNYLVFGTERTSKFNYGVEKANGEYFYYIAPDFELEKDVVKRAVEEVIQKGVEAIIIPNIADVNSFWAACHALEKRTYNGDDLIEAARFFSKEIYKRAGGYDNDIVSYEEHDLWNRMLKVGVKWSRITDVNEIHFGEPDNLSWIIKKSYYIGKTSKKYIKRHSKKAVRQLFPIRPSFLKKWKILASDPAHLVGLAFMKVIMYFSASIGLIRSFFPCAFENKYGWRSRKH